MARRHSLPIEAETNQVIGYLVPVGRWVLEDHDVIKCICDWRQRAMQNYLTQFISTVERTATYLRDLAIGEPGRLLFMIYTDEDQLIGHVGVQNVDGRSAELDNLMRGERGGHPQLIQFSERAILKWCFKTLNLSSIYLRVLSYNFLAIELHSYFGFEIAKEQALFRSETSGIVTHSPVASSDSNVDYTYTHMVLDKDMFVR